MLCMNGARWNRPFAFVHARSLRSDPNFMDKKSESDRRFHFGSPSAREKRIYDVPIFYVRIRAICNAREYLSARSHVNVRVMIFREACRFRARKMRRARSGPYGRRCGRVTGGCWSMHRRRSKHRVRAGMRVARAMKKSEFEFAFAPLRRRGDARRVDQRWSNSCFRVSRRDAEERKKRGWKEGKGTGWGERKATIETVSGNGRGPRSSGPQ